MLILLIISVHLYKKQIDKSNVSSVGKNPELQKLRPPLPIISCTLFKNSLKEIPLRLMGYCLV